MDQRILIVDDCEVNVEILQELLQDEYELAFAYSGEECLEKFRAFQPDLVLLDIMMPGLDGYETCRRIKASCARKHVQVILVSGKAMTQERLRGYEVGADDYMVKPFDHEEMLAKVRIHFRLRDALAELWSAHAKIERFNTELEYLVQQRAGEAVATRDVAIFALARLAESRDPQTGEHLERIRSYCMILARQLGEQGPHADRIDAQFIEDLYHSCPLHDVGKVSIPDAILLKPGRLTKDEFEIMKQHSALGADALQRATGRGNCAGFLSMAIDIARHHHERFDGLGYPDGLAGEEIPLAARIVAPADTFDALTSDRVYKAAQDPIVAKRTIEQSAGTCFDPGVVEALLARYDDFLHVVGLGADQEVEMAEAVASNEVRR